MSNGLEDFSLFDLFRMEAEEQVRVLQSGLIELESGAATTATLEALMRAAHSLKGAARIVGLDSIVNLTHVVEDRFVAAQQGRTLDAAEVDRMLTATDWLARLQAVPESETSGWFEANAAAIEAFIATFGAEAATQAEQTSGAQAAQSAASQAEPPAAHDAEPSGAEPPIAEPEDDIFAQHVPGEQRGPQRHIRIAADRFDKIMSMASETLVASRTLAGYANEFERRRRAIARAVQVLEDPASGQIQRDSALREMDRQALAMAVDIAEFDQIARAHERTAEDLYRSVLAGRLRPFSEGIRAASRLVRDTARELGKQVRLEVMGESTRVDRDILERLEAPVSHLITNAIDHGIETPEERTARGKSAEAWLRIHARHENGRLVITVQDDGRGVYPDELRERVVSRGLVTQETAAGLSDGELLEFLFLPGFSTRESVSAVSGRGVGLNVVQSMVQEAGGSVVVRSEPNAGTTFRLTLPVTRSVVRVIRIQVEGELYAVPLVRIDRVAHLELVAAADSASAPTVEFNGAHVPVVALGPLLGLSSRPLPSGAIPVLLCGGLAFAVDQLVDEVELPVRRLDPRLGKIPGVSAASLDENGLPLLILDVEDLIQTALGRPASTGGEAGGESSAPHILVVDDSHTVREMERRLLVRAGYQVTTAQNGQEAWNLLRLNDYDLLISDIDMPQMNGIELVTKVRANARLARMPVIILSYKGRDEDRRRGLDAGADFYLTKGDFQNENFRQAVVDLIGAADAAE
ncbi:MAG: response regulator [Acidobacteriaceae bacterium]|jgi:two-component system sensor histidine kinase and response regulator WspE